MPPLEYTLKRSKRKTLSLQVTNDLQVIVRAPMRLSRQEIEYFVQKHWGWVEEKLKNKAIYKESHPEPTDDELAEFKKQARQKIPPRVEHYAKMMGLSPTGVKITSAKTRFGSCSPKNSLCFSCRLMQFPPPAIDYVVVHELAHIVHKNHSRAFYALVASVLPDYKARQALLRK